MGYKKVKIMWTAFGGDASLEYQVSDKLEDLMICEALFAQTNTQFGPAWGYIKPKLPKDRTHTSLSVGDMIEVDGTVYRCEDIGWSVVVPQN
jgi:hypothetical protein